VLDGEYILNIERTTAFADEFSAKTVWNSSPASVVEILCRSLKRSRSMRLMRINWFYSHPKCISLFFAPESGRGLPSLARKCCVPQEQKIQGKTEVRYS